METSIRSTGGRKRRRTRRTSTSKIGKGGGHAAGHEYGVIAGTGDGHIDHSIRGAVAMDYDGFAVMEPHLRGGGPTGGITGPDLFPYATDAFRAILKTCGGTEG
jgi:hypothetical protein